MNKIEAAAAIVAAAEAMAAAVIAAEAVVTAVAATVAAVVVMAAAAVTVEIAVAAVAMVVEEIVVIVAVAAVTAVVTEVDVMIAAAVAAATEDVTIAPPEDFKINTGRSGLYTDKLIPSPFLVCQIRNGLGVLWPIVSPLLVYWRLLADIRNMLINCPEAVPGGISLRC